MNEGKRIEGQMFMRGGVGWAVALVLLVLAAGGTLLIGYMVNRWVGFTSSVGLSTLSGGSVAPAGGAGGAGEAAAWTMGIPAPGAPSVQVDTVPWPVPAGAPFREHWEKKQPGIGTLHMWYMDPASPQGWQWGSAISIPVKGEINYVLVVNLPKDVDPLNATNGQLWVCELAVSPLNGDVMPNENTVRLRASLDAAKIKHLWENDFPPGLVKDLIDAANGKGPLSGTPAGLYQMTPIDSYFVQQEAENAPDPTQPSGDKTDK